MARTLSQSAAAIAPAPAAPTATLASPVYAPDPDAPGPMLRYERTLPRLPVPALDSTAAKYLDTLRPHLTSVEFAASQAAVADFLASPLAAELQRRLQARAAEPDRHNWLVDWWNETAYMGYRDPVVVFVSYFFVHLDDPRYSAPAVAGALARRAAGLLSPLLEFRELVETAKLEPDKVRGVPLAMSSYKWLFNASRYPVKPLDTARKFSPATNNHIVFIRKNKFFEVPVAVGGTLLSTAEFESQVERVVEMAGDEKGPPIGALTSQNRNLWADDRAALLAASPVNAASLSRIESAIIVVALDEVAPVTREDIAWHTWVGDGCNRWYDKHQLIVFENGRSGFLGEHSCMDGTPTLRLNEYIVARAHSALAPTASSPAPLRSLPPPTPLPFAVPAASPLPAALSRATTEFASLTHAHTLRVLHIAGFGTRHIKALRAPPDAWVQLVMQLAWQRWCGQPGVAYESAQTRRFCEGRTEVVRSASAESKVWAEAMCAPGVEDTTRAALFRAALVRHVQYAAWAAAGEGVDRHLFGLRRLLRAGEPMPALFTDPAYARSSHWEMSTSQLSSPHVDGWGYGEVVPEGFGLAYAIGEDYLRWTITSQRDADDVEALRACLAEAAADTRALMERVVAREGGAEKEGRRAKL